MLVSGGQILAIDHVVKNDTLVGDGSTKPLGVNTDVIATTTLVSDTSAKLQNEIDAVSSNFDNYYTKNETSAASEISAALECVIRHEIEVSAADNTIDVSSATLQDGTVVYKIKASSNTNIIGVDPISAELREDGSWYITYHGSQGNIYNKGPNIDIYQVDDQWYISAAVPDVSNFLTSAVGHEGKTLVLKDNVWVPADYVIDDDIQNLSATIANTYVSASIFNTYSASVKDKLDELTNVTDVVKETSAKWDEASAFAAHSADFMLSAKLNTFEKDGSSYISGYGESAFYYPPLPEIPEYSGKDGIKVENYEISISANYLSANALDELSGKWEDTANTVSTASGSWNEVSGKFDNYYTKNETSAASEISAALEGVIRHEIEVSAADNTIDVSSATLPAGTVVYKIKSTPLTVTHNVSASGTVAIAPNKNNALICTNSPTIAIAIGAGDGAVYHIQITGACTLALTGVTWGGDEITEVATYAEVSILNNVAVGVLYE